MLALRFAVVSISCFAFALPAQVPGVARSSHGVCVRDGVVHGLGPDFSARFDAAGVAFTPVLGGAVDAPAELRFRLAAVRRGATVVWTRAADPAPEVDGDRVRYVHGSGPTEVYEVAAQAIEQSFVFASRPAGTGDLVVVGQITTDLPLAVAGDDGVRWELPDVGGVAFGAVTGVDATGATVRGALRVFGDTLELRLPGAFVDAATYPLVLDPPIGSVIPVGSSAGDDVRPSAAFAATSGVYLVVWNRQLAGSATEVIGQRMTAAGNLVGSSLLLGNGIVGAQSVAAVHATDRFLVTYSSSATTTFPVPSTTYTLHVVAVAAATGAISNDVVVNSGSSSRSASLAGDSRTGPGSDYALLLQLTAGTFAGSVSLLRVRVPASGDPIVQAGATTVAAGYVGGPRITAHGGASGRWLVTWIELVTATDVVLHAQAFGAAAVGCGTVLDFGAGTLGDVGEPVPATADGTDFAIVWSIASSTDVFAMPCTWTGSCASGGLTAGSTVPVSQLAGLQDQPSIGFAKDKYLVAFRQRATASSTPRVYVKGLEPGTCAECGAEWSMENTVLGLEDPVVATRWSGGEAGSDEALIVWSNTSIRAKRFEARGTGTVQSMGGACFVSGLSDFATYSGRPVLGDDTFALELAAPTAPIVALVVGFSAIGFPCGSCTLVPALDVVLPGVSPTPVPIPCQPSLIGAELYAQWLQLKPSDCPLLPFLANSNALKFTIGE